MVWFILALEPHRHHSPQQTLRAYKTPQSAGLKYYRQWSGFFFWQNTSAVISFRGGYYCFDLLNGRKADLVRFAAHPCGKLKCRVCFWHTISNNEISAFQVHSTLDNELSSFLQTTINSWLFRVFLIWYQIQTFSFELFRSKVAAIGNNWSLFYFPL